MNIKFKLSTLFFLIFFLTSCIEDTFEPSGIETRVFGRVFDNVNDLPVVNQKILISEWNSVPQFSPGPNANFIQILDSTYTDLNGYYAITFKTSGQGDLYYINYEDNNSFWTYYRNPVEIENLGTDTEVNYNFLHLYPVNLLITLAPDVEYLSVRLRSTFTFFTTPDWLTTTNVQYTRQIFTDKNTEEQISFYRTKPDGHKQIATFTIPATNTTELTEFDVYITNDDFIDL